MITIGLGKGIGRSGLEAGGEEAEGKTEGESEEGVERELMDNIISRLTRTWCGVEVRGGGGG